MGGGYSEFLDDIAASSPKFIEVQESLRSNGPVQKSQLVTNSQHMMTFCNSVKSIWTHCVDHYIKQAGFNISGFEDETKLQQVARELQNIKSKDIRNSTAEQKLAEIGAKTLVDVLLGEQSSSNRLSTITPYIELLLNENTAIRWISNLDRHRREAGFEFGEEKYQRILKFLNDDDFETRIPKIAIGALTLIGIVEDIFEDNRPEELIAGTNRIRNRIEKACSESETSSLKVYEQRLNNLTWGPKHYQRDRDVIRSAADALEENKIVCFYGLGGVGKTALAQKLMFDIINNKEPYTHIVTHSSKVGSDQKEINTISPKLKGTLVETNDSISVMDSALVEDQKIRVIGGLRHLLLKIYRETTGSTGDNFGDVTLQKKVFEELRKAENRVLIVLDNYEDIEDNQDDDDVLQIKNEIKEFLDKFSKLPSLKSRVIITTRSSPMDISFGIEVKHLTKQESANLFLEKIRFRSQRTDTTDMDLSSTLLGVHQKLTASEDLRSQLIESFDLWDTHDEHIAHPLIVILAAEDVEKDDFEHLHEVINSWGDGSKAENVIRYCVSKTLGSFNSHEKEIIRRLTLKSNMSSEMNTRFIREKINQNSEQYSDKSGEPNPIQKKIALVQDNELIDLMTRLGDRTFVRVIPKRTTSGGTCWVWNKIVYDYLFKRYEVPNLDVMETPDVEAISNLKEFPSFLHPLHAWTPPNPILITELITPLNRSVENMMKDLAEHADNQVPSFEIESLASNLDKQSVLLLKMIGKVAKHKNTDRSLLTIAASSKTSVGGLVEKLLKFLGRQARCWRYLSLAKNEHFLPPICVQYAIELLNKVNFFATTFFRDQIISNEQYLNLLENIGKEHIEIYDVYADISGTLVERSSMIRLDWLEQFAKKYNPENCSLKDGLEFSEEQYKGFMIWIQVFERTNLTERTKQLATIEGYAFWIFLRLFATNRQFAESHDCQILNELKPNAQFVRKVPHIYQYIQSVQQDIDRMLRKPDEYLSSIVNFRSQPTNGTLLMTPLSYNPELSRWESSLERRGWKVIVRETDRDHSSEAYETVILVQELFKRTDKRIVCSFHRDIEGNITIEPKDSMTLMAELEKRWKDVIQNLITERTSEERNELAFWEVRRVLETQGGPGDSESIDEIVNRITTLNKVDNFYVIDVNKNYSQPPPAYMELSGGKDAFSATWSKTKLLLPPHPSIFAAYLITLTTLCDTTGKTTMNRYIERIRKGFKDSVSNGSLFLFHAMGGKYSADWKNDMLDLVHEPSELIQELVKSVKVKCRDIKRKTDSIIDGKIVDSYFDEVLESFNIQQAQ